MPLRFISRKGLLNLVSNILAARTRIPKVHPLRLCATPVEVESDFFSIACYETVVDCPLTDVEREERNSANATEEEKRSTAKLLDERLKLVGVNRLQERDYE